MSLNWNLPETFSEKKLGYKYRYKGKETDEMNPILHRLIFLTMTLGGDLTGGEKAKADIKKRVAYITRTSPDLTTLSFGEEAQECQVWNGDEWVSFFSYYNPTARYKKNANGNVKELAGWDVIIDDNWIDFYWGLSTNADRKSFTKWFNHFNKKTLELMERGR